MLLVRKLGGGGMLKTTETISCACRARDRCRIIPVAMARGCRRPLYCCEILLSPWCALAGSHYLIFRSRMERALYALGTTPARHDFLLIQSLMTHERTKERERRVIWERDIKVYGRKARKWEERCEEAWWERGILQQLQGTSYCRFYVYGHNNIVSPMRLEERKMREHSPGINLIFFSQPNLRVLTPLLVTPLVCDPRDWQGNRGMLYRGKSFEIQNQWINATRLYWRWHAWKVWL